MFEKRVSWNMTRFSTRSNVCPWTTNLWFVRLGKKLPFRPLGRSTGRAITLSGQRLTDPFHQQIDQRHKDGKTQHHVPDILMPQGVYDQGRNIPQQPEGVRHDVPAVVSQVSADVDTERIQPHDRVEEEQFPRQCQPRKEYPFHLSYG